MLAVVLAGCIAAGCAQTAHILPPTVAVDAATSREAAFHTRWNAYVGPEEALGLLDNCAPFRRKVDSKTSATKGRCVPARFLSLPTVA